MKIKINDTEYNVIKDYGDTIDIELLNEYVTDYYDSFDYIVGDWAYGHLRLKGFYNKNNKLKKEYNDYSKVDEYIENNCAYGCKHFILEKIVKKSVEKEK